MVLLIASEGVLLFSKEERSTAAGKYLSSEAHQ
jgi:hypothetical protein